MSNLGSYQTIVETAKAVGGPDALAEMLVNKGMQIGIKSQRPNIVMAGLAGIAIGGLLRHYAPELGKLKADKILEADEELDVIKAEFKRVINNEEDIERVSTMLNDEDIEVEEELTLDELKERLESLRPTDTISEREEIADEFQS